MAKPVQAQRGRDTNGDVSLEMSGSSQGSFDGGENRGEAAGPGAALAEVRPLLVWLHRALPFLILLLLKLGFQHRTGLAILIGLFVTFSYGNHLVKSQVARGEKRSSIRALLMALYLVGNVLFLYYCFHSQNLHLSLLFLPPSLEPLHLWDLLWVVGITDFIIKFGTVFLKTLLLALPQALLPFRHRGSCYEVVEEGSLLYRVLAPVRLWVTFLVHSSLDGFLLGFALSILYLLLKCMTVYSRLPCLGRACFKLWHCQPMGLPASKQQCAQAGQLCPICQGNFCRPALLLCQHVFCEECIGLWLDRERCCPLCRLIVWEGGRRGRDGGTSTHLQLY